MNKFTREEIVEELGRIQWAEPRLMSTEEMWDIYGQMVSLMDEVTLYKDALRYLRASTVEHNADTARIALAKGLEIRDHVWPKPDRADV